MRFSKKKLLVACARALPALAAVLPPGGVRSDVARPEGKQLLDLDLHEDYAQATFTVPCAGCLGTSHDDESIVLSVKTHANEEACGVSNITLNGAYLSQEWNGDFASGSGSYTGVTDIQENAWFLQHDLDLEWESACLHGEEEADDTAQVLTVNIKSIDGKSLSLPYPGFTLSFKQASPPELLRLQSTPDLIASSSEHAESWRKPPTHLRLTLPKLKGVESFETSGHSELEDDIQELKALEKEAKKLQKAIAEKKKYIDSQVRKEAQSFKEELQNCDNLTCVAKTIASGARGAWRILYVRFRPNHHHHHGPPPMGHPDDGFHRVWRPGNNKQGNIKIESEGVPPPPPPPHHDGPGHPPPPPPHHDGPGHPPPPPPPPHHDGPGHPPPPPPPPHSHHGAPRMPPPESPFVIALEVVLGLLCCGCILTVIRHRCSSLRTRTERAAAREERLTRREYRRAARRHAIRKWWRGDWRDQERMEDYEEKRSLIQHQEGVLEEAMQEEIRQLRAAHGVVNDLVSSAEEGRVVTYPHNYCPCSRSHPVPQAPLSPLSTASTYPPTSIPELPSRPLSRTDSLPGYASSSPPAYEEDEDVSDSVANGFRHYSSTDSTTSSNSRWTPDSSIIDVSPRPSAETLRYPEITEASEFAETTETNFDQKS
ncbi:uncharacterized protein N0V89_005360 [Didymosphaeria variabile]|uniref:Uncharacterized protein n=1 Tax=Didymosphaeria variabile TaxID=1932322 RepID=A0A9W9CB77_9PLEO|nr:uncharacterized protein N0V89_005360 [Didymosphaeria variabile]KAJ4353630.1 hypothetical protein N0V89_005360 [Didymosphaeria variabile]